MEAKIDIAHQTDVFKEAMADIHGSFAAFQKERENYLDQITRLAEHSSDLSNRAMLMDFAYHEVKLELEAVKKENEELKKQLKAQELTVLLREEVATMKRQSEGVSILDKLKLAVAAGPIFGPKVKMDRAEVKKSDEEIWREKYEEFHKTQFGARAN